MQDVFNPPKVSATILGQPVEIGPITMGKIQAFTAAVRPIADEIMQVVGGAGNLISVIESHADQLIQAVSIATGAEREKIEAMLPDEFLALATAVLQVNADFFVNRLLPKVTASVAGLNQVIKAATAATAG